MSRPGLSPSDAPVVCEARQGGEEVARSPGFEWFARLGLVSRGVVYAIIGVLAVKLAVGSGGRATDQQGALREIADRPFGRTLLVLVALGLAGYAVWRLVRAALGHGPEQADDVKDRAAGLASGIAYAVLCGVAVKIVTGSTSSSSGPKRATGGVLDWTGGRLLVGAAGVVLIVVALDQAHQGLARKFLEKSKTEQMTPEVRRVFTGLGVFGHVARAVVFALIGYGLVRAAIDFDPSNAVGLDGALRQLQDASYGPVLLGIVAVGLVGFAAYSVADARYRRI